MCLLAFLLTSWQGHAQISRTSNVVVGISANVDSMWLFNKKDYSIVKRLAPSVPTYTVTSGNGIATDPTTGIHYAILKVTGISGRVLAKINVFTGAATLVGNLKDNFASIAFNANGSLFGVTGDGATIPETMYRINKATADTTRFRALGNGDDGEVIAYNPHDNFFYHWSGNTALVYERFDTTGLDAIQNIPVSGVTDGETFGAVYLDSGKFLAGNIGDEFKIWDTAGNISAAVAPMPNKTRGYTTASCASSVLGDGPLAFCPGDSVKFTVSGGTGNYQWYVDGGAVAGATNAAYTAHARGRYNVMYTDSCGVTDSLSAGFAVIVYPNPALTVSAVANVCPGATVAFLPFSASTVLSFTGSPTTYVVPAGVTSLNFDVIGAAGGATSSSPSSPAGFGGRVQGTLSVTPGQLLNINVGGKGLTGTSAGAAGGYNGGGAAASYSFAYSGGGGGGASDIRVGGTSLSQRIIIAGGGGGNGQDGVTLPGGDGGGLTGANSASNPNPGAVPAMGGTQFSGGAGATYFPFTSGASGAIATGGASSGDGISGGGGGGYYGGGGGVWTGGGGGSSFTDPLWVPAVSVTHTQGYNNGNGQVTLSYSLTGTYNIVWSGGATSVGFTNVTAAAIPSSPISITVPVGAPSGVYNGLINFNDGSCSSLDYAFSVIINDTTKMDTPSNQSVCNGGATTAINFTSSVSGTTYSWTNDNTSIGLAASGAGNIPSFTAVNGGTHADTATLVVTPSANGCVGNPVHFMMVVNPTPALTSALTADACSGQTFAYTHTSATPGTTYTWSRAAVGGVAEPASSGSGNISEILTNTTSAAVEVFYIDTLRANGCEHTQAISVTVNPTPVLTSPLTNGTQCDSTIFNYTSTSSTPGVVFSWSRAAIAGNPAAHGTGASISEMLVNTTGLPVEITYVDTLTLGGCAHTQNFTVTVNPTPVLSGPDTAYACDSVNFHYASTSLTPGVTFAWSRVAVPGVSNPDASGVDSVDEILNNTTTMPVAVEYVYTLTPTSCSPHVQIVTVIVNPTLDLSTPLIAPTICGNSLFSYEPGSATPGITYNWMRPSTPGISNPAASGTGNPNEVLVDTTSLKVPVSYVFTLELNGCTNVVNVTDTVKPRPRLTSSLTPSAICDSTLFVYMPGSTLPATTYTWVRPFVAGILSMGSSGTDGVSEYLHNTTSGDKDVTYAYTLTADGCIRTQNVVVTVHPQAKLGTPTDYTICSGVQFNYAPTPFTGTVPVTFAWVRPALSGILPDTISSGTGAIHETLINTTTSPITVHYGYEITVAGTCTTHETINLVVNPAGEMPSITTKSTANLCKGTMYQNFGASTMPPSGTSYIWSATNATVFATGNTKQYSLVNFPSSGTAVVRLSSSVGTAGCAGTDSVIVSVSNTDAQTFSAIYARGQFIALINDVDSYQWGYDDAATLDSVLIPGAIDQSYFPSSVDFTTKNYWVMTKQGDCTQKVYINTPTGVSNVNTAAAPEVKIYPNPAGEYVNVEVSKDVIGNIQVEVMNVLGQKIDVMAAVDNMARIDVAKFVPGAYLVNCYSNGVKIASARFIKN